jgi:galacturan 1,4-alpha-galacturonidase
MHHPAAVLISAFLVLCSLFNFGAATSSCPPTLPSRPTSTPHPHSPGKPHHPSPPRSKTCYVHAHGGGKDDSQSIFSAAKACNYGGTIALLDAQYTIAQTLDLTFLNAVDIVIAGEVSFTPDIPYWTGNSFKYTYQTASLFWQIGGTDVNIYGGGTINGNGQIWWDAMVTNSTLQRPILMGIIGLQSGSISNLKLINPPNWFHFVANSSDLIFDNMNLTALSNDTNAAKNSGKFLWKGHKTHD